MKYFTDGYTLLKNPSTTGGGYSIVNEDGEVLKHHKIEKVGFTNNDGEILGIKECVEKYCEMFDEISTDSMCAIAWVKRGKSKSRKDLNILLNDLRNKIEEKNINVYWEPREDNLAGHFNEDFDTAKPQS